MNEFQRMQKLAGLITESQLNENQYLIRTRYIVPKNWFNDPMDVLKTNIYGLKIEKIISSSDIKNPNYDNNNFTADVNFISNVDKTTFADKLKGMSTSSEKWEII